MSSVCPVSPLCLPLTSLAGSSGQELGAILCTPSPPLWKSCSQERADKLLYSQVTNKTLKMDSWLEDLLSSGFVYRM